MAEAQVEEQDESLIEHRFCIDLIGIRLINEDQINCLVKYKFKLFESLDFTVQFILNDTCRDECEEFSTESFTICSDKKWHEIPDSGYREHIVSPKKSTSYVKNFLENQKFEIMIFDDEVQIGSAMFNLSNLMNEDSKLRYMKKEAILSIDNPEKIGILHCNFVLEKEECVRCKSCKNIYKNSSIRKHINGKCKKAYSEEDIKCLIDQSNQKRKEKQAIREKKNYDPEARAKRHRETYNSEARKELYLSKKGEKKSSKVPKLSEIAGNDRQQMYEEQRKNDIIKMKKNLDHEAKNLNLNNLRDATNYYQQGMEVIKCMNLEKESVLCLEKLEHKLTKVFDQLDIELELYADNVKNMKKYDDISNLYKTLMPHRTEVFLHSMPMATLNEVA